MEKNPTMLFVVAAALIDAQGRICLQKRPENKVMAGLWEFPGGKVETGEQPEAALARELREELDITVDPANLQPITFASESVGGHDLLLLLYICDQWNGDVTAMEASDIKWVRPQEMIDLQMPPADAPFIPILEDFMKRRDNA